MRTQAKDIVVTTWNEVNDRLYEGDWNERLHRHRPTFVFRGEGHGDQLLRSGLFRLNAPAVVEEHLLRNFRKYGQRDLSHGHSFWMWLALGQHHGLPTRLLDWTHSPQVALHFATADESLQEQDAAVWCVDYRKTNCFLPARLSSVLESQGSDLFTMEMLDGLAHGLGEWDQQSGNTFAVFWEPPSFDDRIINQFAVFSLLSSPSAELHCWLEQHSECYRRIRIPAKLKREIRDRLDQANVTERILFPGLDGLCRWLTRYYGSETPVLTTSIQ